MKLVFVLHSTAVILEEWNAKLGPNVEVVPVLGSGGGMSSMYDRLAWECPTIESLAARFKPRRALVEYEAVWLACWSAGYGYPRTIKKPVRDRFDGIVMLDSGHTHEDPDGTASDQGVAWAVDMARRALASEAVFWLGHTDVQTYGTTASTTQFAEEVVRLAGAVDQGGFHVRSFNVAENAKTEHIAALRDPDGAGPLKGWGAAFVAEAMGEPTEADTDPPPETLPKWRDQSLSLGERCVLWSLSQIDRPNAEEAPRGSNAGPYIAWLLSRCERNGKPLGIKRGNYCAGGVSTAMLECAGPDEPLPHRPRTGVVELVADAQGKGLHLTVEQLRNGYQLMPGDLLFFDRSVPGRPENRVVDARCAGRGNTLR